MNSGTKIQFTSEAYLKMTQLSNEEMKIDTEMNTGYKTNSELKDLMSKLEGREVEEGFGLFPPFLLIVHKIYIWEKKFLLIQIINFKHKARWYLHR